LINGIEVWNGAENTDYVSFCTKALHLSNKIYENSNVTVKFDWTLEQPNNAQMDIYSFGFSGVTDIENSKYKPVYYQPSSSALFPSASTYLGSLTRENKNKTCEFNLTSDSNGHAGLMFAFRRGHWHLKDIEIYAQNQTRILAPLDNLFVTGSELLFKFEYNSPDGAKSNTTTNLYGVKFDGNQVAPKKDYKPIIVKKSIISTFDRTIQKDNDNNLKFNFNVNEPTDGYEYVTGYSNGYNYTINYNIVGIIIEPPTYEDNTHYIWAGSTQGRGLMTNINSPTETIIYEQTAISGSVETNKFGGFGTPNGSFVQWDSWLTMTPVSLDVDGNIQMSFIIEPVVGLWNVYGSAEMELYRYERKI
jgi:hypothetical protein